MNLTEQQKEVLHHAIDNGWNTIEGRDFGSYWQAVNMFSWSMVFTGKVELRIKQVPDSINWEHISTKIAGIARDEDGECYGYTKPAILRSKMWASQNNSYAVQIEYFSSYKQGTVSWENSWVPNPFYEEGDSKNETEEN